MACRFRRQVLGLRIGRCARFFSWLYFLLKEYVLLLLSISSLNFSQSLSALVFFLVPGCHPSSVRSSLRNIANSLSQLLHTSYLQGQHGGESLETKAKCT